MITITKSELRTKKDNTSDVWVTAKEGVDFVPIKEEDGYLLGSFNFIGWTPKSVLGEDQKSSPKIVYKSQWGIGAQRRKNDCGLACVAMFSPTASIDNLAQKYDFEDDGTTSDQISACLTELKIQNVVSSVIKTPSIALVYYRFDRNKVWDKNFYGLHWLVVLNITNTEVTCHDPNFPSNKGENIRFSRAEWDRSYAGSCINVTW